MRASAPRRGRRDSWAGALLVAWASLAWPAATFTEEGGEACGQARLRFEQGVAAARAEDLQAALSAFAQSFELCPQPGTLLNLGLYQLRAGRRPEAYRSLSDLLDRYGEVISRTARSEVGQQLRQLEAELALVTVSSRPPGASIVVDGADLGQTPLAAPLAREPGPCEIQARLEGYQPASETIELRAGERTTVALVLSPLPPPAPVLVVSSGTRGARASLDGAPAEPLPLRRPTTPGQHSLAVEAPGHALQQRTVTVPETGELGLTVDLVPLAAPPPEPPVVPPRRPLWRRPWPWIVGAVVVATAATAAALGVTLSEPDDDWVLEVR